MLLLPVTRLSSRLSSGYPARAFDRLFDENFDRFLSDVLSAPAVASRTPALDVAENDTSYTVAIEMPGVAKEDIKVAIDGQRVDVTAEAKQEREAKDGERVVHRERRASSWSRSFTLASDIDQATSNAKFENGVLMMVLGKKRATAAAQLPVD